MKLAALIEQFSEMTPDELKRARRSLRFRVIITTLALLVAISTPYMAKLLSPTINRWLWPPIPVLAVTETTAGLRFDGKDDYVEAGPFDWPYPQFTMEAFVTSDGSSDNGTIASMMPVRPPATNSARTNRRSQRRRRCGAGAVMNMPRRTRRLSHGIE